MESIPPESPGRLIEQLLAALRDMPVEDLKQNGRAFLAARLAELDLVPRAEYDQQVAALSRAQVQLKALEARVEALERARAAVQREN
jgi:BMFP domain-containing protein YqiC